MSFTTSYLDIISADFKSNESLMGFYFVFINTRMINSKPYLMFRFQISKTNDSHNHNPVLQFEFFKNAETDKKSNITSGSNINHRNTIKTYLESHLRDVADIQRTELKGSLIYEDHMYVFIEYLKSNKYNELNYFKKKTYIECSGYDVLNTKRCESYRFDDAVLKFFQVHSNIVKIQDSKTNLTYPLPTTIYYGTKTSNVNEIILLGKESFKQDTFIFSYYDYDMAKHNSNYEHVIDDSFFKIRLTYNSKQESTLIAYKNKTLQFKNQLLIHQSPSTGDKLVMKLKASLPLLEESNVVITEVDVFSTSFVMRIKKKYAVTEHSMFLTYFKSILNKNNSLIIRYTIFLDDYDFVSESDLSTNKSTRYFTVVKNHLHVISDNIMDLSICDVSLV